MNKEEYADKFMSRAKQDIKMCEEKHGLEVYVAGLLENIDYWQKQYDYIKRHRDTMQQENKSLKEELNKYKNIVEILRKECANRQTYVMTDFILETLKGSDSNE